MNSRKNEILRIIEKHPEGLTAHAIADLLKMDRSNVSRYLNELYKEQQITKGEGRPVIYAALATESEKNHVDTSSAITFVILSERMIP